MQRGYGFFNGGLLEILFGIKCSVLKY